MILHHKSCAKIHANRSRQPSKARTCTRREQDLRQRQLCGLGDKSPLLAHYRCMRTIGYGAGANAFLETSQFYGVIDRVRFAVGHCSLLLITLFELIMGLEQFVRAVGSSRANDRSGDDRKIASVPNLCILWLGMTSKPHSRFPRVDTQEVHCAEKPVDASMRGVRSR
jgi:hypothetical protein